MPTLALLRDDLAAAYDGDPWHGDSFRAILHGVEARHAAARPVPSAHSIWEIVLHVAAWMEIGTERLSSFEWSVVGDGRDWPPAPEPSDDAAWTDALARLDTAHHALLAAVDVLGEADVARPLGVRDRAQGTGGTVGYLLAGLAQHAAYHGGQIALLRKALG